VLGGGGGGIVDRVSAVTSRSVAAADDVRSANMPRIVKWLNCKPLSTPSSLPLPFLLHIVAFSCTSVV